MGSPKTLAVEIYDLLNAVLAKSAHEYITDIADVDLAGLLS